MLPAGQSSRPRLTLGDDARTIYAIGDVHGCLEQLLRLEALIVEDARTRGPGPKTIIMLGDLVDRGPASAGVVSHVTAPAPQQFERLCLSGNHEVVMLESLAGNVDLDLWIEWGGLQTLASYGLATDRPAQPDLLRNANLAIPDEHLAFLRGLPIAVRWRDYVFVHAGIRPGVPFDQQDDADLLEIREPFLRLPNDLGLTVVHGHSPVRQPQLMPDRVGIDLGCFATGRLAAARVDRSGVGILIA